MPSKSVSMSASDVTLTPHLPTSPSDSSWSGSRPISVGRSNATLRPVPPAASSVLVARVGLLRRAEPGELPHRPELAAVAGRVNAARVGKRAGVADVARVVDRGEVVGRVEAFDRPAGDRRERRTRARATCCSAGSSVSRSQRCLADSADWRSSARLIISFGRPLPSTR